MKHFLVETNGGLPSDDYVVVIFDINTGCEVVHEVTLGSATSQITPVLTPGDIDCFGDEDGTITITADPGISGTNGPVTYLILDENSLFAGTGTLNATGSTTYETDQRTGFSAGRLPRKYYCRQRWLYVIRHGHY